jgi:hypothetical protein
MAPPYFYWLTERRPEGARQFDFGHPDGLAGGVQPPDVSELAERDERGDLAHPVLGHQRPAAGLMTRERAQVPLELAELRMSRSMISKATVIRSRASTGTSRPARNRRPARVRSSSGAPAMPW